MQKTRHSIRLWTIPSDAKNKRFMFGYSPWSLADGKFYAYKYRRVSNGWQLAKKLGFARRKVARERSLQWHRKYYNEQNKKQPKPPKPKPTDQDKLTKIEARIKATQTKIKRLTTHLKKLKRSEKYYHRKKGD